MNKLEVVMYHYVRDLQNSRYPDIKGLDVHLFRKQLKYLKENYTFVDLPQILEAIYGGSKLPDNALLLTFDDGYIDHYTTVFPLLAAEGISGLFAMSGKVVREQKVLDVNKIHYILASTPIEVVKKTLVDQIQYYRMEDSTIESIDELYEKYAKPNRFDSADIIFVKRMMQTVLPERIRNMIVDDMFGKFVSSNERSFATELYMNLDHVRVMKKYNMHFSLHGYEHYWFDNLTEKQYKEDINNALDVFEGIIDRNSWTFCYPYGASQDNLLEYCKSINCVAGFTVEARIADLDRDNPLLIPRFDTNDYPPKCKLPKSKQIIV